MCGLSWPRVPESRAPSSSSGKRPRLLGVPGFALLVHEDGGSGVGSGVNTKLCPALSSNSSPRVDGASRSRGFHTRAGFLLADFPLPTPPQPSQTEPGPLAISPHLPDCVISSWFRFSLFSRVCDSFPFKSLWWDLRRLPVSCAPSAGLTRVLLGNLKICTKIIGRMRSGEGKKLKRKEKKMGKGKGWRPGGKSI